MADNNGYGLKGKLIGGAISIITAMAIGAFVFAWETHASVVAMDIRIGNIENALTSMVAIQQSGTEMNIENDKDLGVLRAHQETLDKAIAEIKLTIRDHKNKRNAHQ